VDDEVREKEKGELMNRNTVMSILALTGAVLVLSPSSARAAAGGSGTEETLMGNSAAEAVTGGTASGAGPLEDGAARAEASEGSAGGRLAPADPYLVYPKSVQHQSTAANPLCVQGGSLVGNPNTGYTPSENSPSSEPMGNCLRTVALQEMVYSVATTEVVREAPAPGTKIVVLRGPHFDFDRSALKPKGRMLLDEAIAIMKENPGLRVMAEGHTDWMGTDGYNQKLGERRDGTVRDYLVAGGIDPNRIDVESFGESRPVATNETDAGRADNRRVELIAL
jgi:outer membrane protein OmpA-like peptidoglycan-associated protein